MYFFAELGLTNYATMMYCPSMLAASAVYAARCTLNKTPVWDQTLELHTGYPEAYLQLVNWETLILFMLEFVLKIFISYSIFLVSKQGLCKAPCEIPLHWWREQA